MNLMILSAGLGTRLKPVTDKIPKPAIPVLNVPMFFYSFHYFNSVSVDNVVVNTFHKEALLKEKLSSVQKGLTFISDGDSVLGTGGGIKNAQTLLEGKGSFWVANGDCVFLSNSDFINGTQKIHLLNNPIATLVVTDHPEVGTKFGGVWVDKNDRVIDIGKVKPANAVHGYHFTGFRILSDLIFQYLQPTPSELFDALRAAIKDGHDVRIYKTEGEFFETGNLTDYLNCTRALLEKLNGSEDSSFLNSLLEKYSPASVLNDLETDLKLPSHPSLEYLLCDENFKIFDRATLEGFVVAGKNVVIKEGAHLKNVVILDDQLIASNSEIVNDIILD